MENGQQKRNANTSTHHSHHPFNSSTSSLLFITSFHHFFSNTSDVIYCNGSGSPSVECFPDPSDPTTSWESEGIAQSFGMAYYAGDTYEILFRCYYTVEAENEILDQVGADGSGGLIPDEDALRLMNKLYADVWVARYHILGAGLGGSLFFGLLYITLMRIPFLLSTIVWTSIFLTIALFFVGGYFTFVTAQDWEDEEPQTVDDNTINVRHGSWKNWQPKLLGAWLTRIFIDLLFYSFFFSHYFRPRALPVSYSGFWEHSCLSSCAACANKSPWPLDVSKSPEKPSITCLPSSWYPSFKPLD